MAAMKLPGSPLNPGDHIDHYRIDRVVARSNEATVFFATDLRDGSEVAVKVPPPEMENDPAFADHFNREVETRQLLDHPAIAKVIPNPDRTRLYMAMEWFPGKTLREILEAEKKLAPERAVTIAIAIADVLEYIHAGGIVRLDLHPESILVGVDDRIRLIDFGGAVKTGARRLTLTRHSQIMGISEYVSPEELKGKRGDARSDIYSLGVILYEMLTGKLPFEPSDPNDRLLHYPVPPRELVPAISPQLQEVIYRALERDPHNRYATARNFAMDLQNLDAVGVADRPELRDWKKKRRQPSKNYLLYALIVLIPLVILAGLLYVARHR